jgi:hypothetical protein
MESWSVQSLQFVWFLTRVDDSGAAAAFQKIFEFPPDQTQVNRIPTSGSPFFSSAMSEADGRLMRFSVAPGRADLIVAAQPNETDPLSDLFELNATLNDLLSRVEAAALHKERVYRVSLVSTLLKRVERYADGVEEFFRSLGFDPKVDDPSDLLFQVNSRVIVGDREINRLMHLSTLEFQRFALDLVEGAPPAPQQRLGFAARRQLDFNTVPDGRLMEYDEQVAIFRWLATETQRIADDGRVVSLKKTS